MTIEGLRGQVVLVDFWTYTCINCIRTFPYLRELYDNPDDVQGDLSRARYSPLVDTWGFLTIDGWTNESWTFVLDRNGRIAARFEAFVP